MEETMKIFSSLGLASPSYFLIAGAAIIFLIFFPIWKIKKNLRWDRNYWKKKLPELKQRKHWVLLVFIVLTSLVVAAAFANLQLAEKKIFATNEKPVMLLIDVSGSINPSDSAEKNAFSVFVEVAEIYREITSHDLGAAIGISFYSDQNYIARNFASKPEYLKDTIENKKELEEISRGTKTAPALFHARAFFSEKIQAKDKTIILISDLEDDYFSIANEIRQIANDGINLYVIVVTKESQKAHGRIQNLKRNGNDNIKMVWFKDKDEINQIYQEISEMESSPAEVTDVTSRKSLLPFLLLLILGLILLSIIISETIFRKIP